MTTLKAAVLASLMAAAGARDVPENVRNFYNSVKARGDCSNKLATGFHSEEGDAANFSYCGDHLTDDNVIYLQGPHNQFVNIDIDCDGIQKGPADDGRCGSSDDTQSQTSFQDIVRSYGTGQKDLDANAHTYVVFGNEGSKKGYKTFDPRKYGVEPLSVMAAVCGDKLVYGVWGDTNGDDGPSLVGEASISLATLCYGKSMNGNNGHAENDVLFIAFPGKDAVPGAKGAKWNAQNANEFEASISGLGDKLIQRLGGGGGGGGGDPSPTPTPSPPTNNCSWKGHCAGASCRSGDDCADDLRCRSGKCAA
ncbi:Endo-chitosanase [Cladobotryum mycophilum]|uniref:Endo-chitosanase n=1 Tax=Cladobotryum mycophilum TaxID=491253 RepID=A0ABR0SYJ1_9HYPO